MTTIIRFLSSLVVILLNCAKTLWNSLWDRAKRLGHGAKLLPHKIRRKFIRLRRRLPKLQDLLPSRVLTGEYIKFLQNPYARSKQFSRRDLNKIGHRAFRDAEKDKKARSGLVRFYNTQSSSRIYEAICHAAGHEIRPAFQAALETLIGRDDYATLCEILFQIGDILPDSMVSALKETFARHQQLPRLVEAIAEGIGTRKINNTEFLDDYVSAHYSHEIRSFTQFTLKTLKLQYSLLGETDSQSRIRTLLKSQIQERHYREDLPRMPKYVKDFLNIA